MILQFLCQNFISPDWGEKKTKQPKTKTKQQQQQHQTKQNKTKIKLILFYFNKTGVQQGIV